MNDQLRTTTGRNRRGQTLVVALIILGVLLVLGVVFIGLIKKSIVGARNSHERSIAFDLAEAGVRYAHNQMMFSVLAADWRPTPTPPGGTVDADYEYLRPANPADTTDYGGPDKLGPYSRISFDRGRALIRVRYAPGDPTIFSASRVGDFYQPGLARNYTIIESVGKAKAVLPGDPTSGSLASGVTKEIVETKKVVAFVACGLMEHAWFITDKFKEARAAQIGWSSIPEANYDDAGGAPSPVIVPIVLGTSDKMFNPYTTGPITPTVSSIPYGGGFQCNTALEIHGNVVAYINQVLGDKFAVNGTIRGADDQSSLKLIIGQSDNNLPNPAFVTNQFTFRNNQATDALNSDSPNFNTHGRTLLDDSSQGDSVGWTRGQRRDDPPSTLVTDPDTGLNRYIQMTRFGGHIINNVNSGNYGFGPGVYIGNSDDIQVPTDEQGREDVGSAESLVYDWLNPNNNQAKSGWQGAYYVPRGAYLRLFNDGFEIIRDGKAPANQRTWKEPDGSVSKRPGALMNSANPADIVDSPYVRYKLVYDPVDGQTYIFNSYSVDPLTNRVIDLSTVTTSNVHANRAWGYAFNGVLYFAGNVRVRGTIPTDMQMTVISGATIYVEGSIVKGVINTGTRGNLALGARVDTPSKSMLALLAKDYVTLNTTQFFGPAPTQSLEEVKEAAGPVEWDPLRVRTGGSLDLITDLILDPNTAGGNPLDPRTWKPYVTTYIPDGAVNGFEQTNMLLWHTMDDGPAPATFLNADINYRLGNPFANGGEWNYLFELNNSNAASPYYAPGYIPPPYSVSNRFQLYGLGVQSWQRYSKLEGAAFPLVSSDFTFTPLPGGSMLVNGANTSPTGLYHFLIDDENDITLGNRETVAGTATNDYIVARSAIVPQDIRIEATMFAEEGSFFVIPGPWFNPNSDDRRDTYASLGATQAERDLARLENYGSTPNMPFYGEPLDVRIQIFGSISENMPPPMSQQTAWLKKWGWIPRTHGATGEVIPTQHAQGYNVGGGVQYVPNLSVIYDPSLATDRNSGFVGTAGPAVDRNTLIRYQGVDLTGDGVSDVFYALPPLPRMPVSPSLAYFGEVNP